MLMIMVFRGQAGRLRVPAGVRKPCPVMKPDWDSVNARRREGAVGRLPTCCRYRSSNSDGTI